LTLLSPHSAPADYRSHSDLGFNGSPINGSAYVTVQQACSGLEPTHFIQNGGYISVNEAKQQLNPANGAYITVNQVQANAIVT
jgi:hypothetical protein